MSTATDERQPAAHSLRGGSVRKRPLAWLPWTALLLAGLIGLGALLIARNVGDAGDEPGVDLVDDPAAAGQDPPGPDANADDGSDRGSEPDDGEATDDEAVATTAPNRPSTTAPPTSAPGSNVEPAAGSVAADREALLPAPASGYAPFVGRSAQGRAVTVESVVGDEAFWVGANAEQRILLVLTPEARGTQGESPFQVTAGQQVTFDGDVVALDRDPADFGLQPAEGGDQLRSQGVYLLITEIALG